MSTWDIKNIVKDLQQARHEWRTHQKNFKDFGGRELPSKEEIQKIMNNLCGILFPMRLGPYDLRQESEDFYIAHTLEKTLHALLEQVRLNLFYNTKAQVVSTDIQQLEEKAKTIVTEFAESLADMRRMLDTDVIAAYQGDPAARSVDEVLICYPGIQAIIYHRVAHAFYQKELSLLARIISELSHSQTGIDIHPGAIIDEGFFIDHGTGVVIGETSIIGKNVRIYQAVTLGAKRFEVDEAGHLQKQYARHPIVGDGVVIYAGATVLGRITIGNRAVIGANVWVTKDVAEGTFFSGA